MRLGVGFTPQGWEDYKSWDNDRAVRRRIDRLIDDLRRDPDGPGIGKRERLHGPLAGWSSVRITDEHRIVYRATGDRIEIAECRGHYTLKGPATP